MMKLKFIQFFKIILLLVLEALVILYFYSEFPVGEIRAVYENY